MFGETLKNKRMGANLSVASLAELASTSRSAITEYEAGTKTPRIDTAERLLKVLAEPTPQSTSCAKHQSA